MDFFRRCLEVSLRKVSMAKIIWRKRPLKLLDSYIENALVEYGRSTAIEWAEEISTMEQRLIKYPSSYTPENLLLGKKRLFRGCHIMNRRFKVIYTYDDNKDIVYIMDIWDTKMNPQALIRRIK